MKIFICKGVCIQEIREVIIWGHVSRQKIFLIFKNNCLGILK